jgi:hypothetical protein
MITLSRAVAQAMVHGPKAGLALLGTLDGDERMAHTHRLEAVRAHLLELAGETVAARESYLRAARMTASLPEQRYLARRVSAPPRRLPTRRANSGPGTLLLMMASQLLRRRADESRNSNPRRGESSC